MVDNLDYEKLEKLLDIVKAKTFIGKNAAFLGSIMTGIPFFWDTTIKTAQTNGLHIKWNPHFFLSIPEEARISILMHELWHIGLLHPLRFAFLDDKELANMAADVHINNDLHLEGYKFPGVRPYINLHYRDKSLEEIYEDLEGLPVNEILAIQSDGPWGDGEDPDVVIDEDEVLNEPYKIINKVVAAATAAELAGERIPGETGVILKRFLQPKLPWKSLLINFFNDLITMDYKMTRPNRRYIPHEMYMPSLLPDEGLEHLAYYFDTSGSVSDAMVIRFNSEVKYIWDYFKPKKLTIIQFDNCIQNVTEFKEGDNFDELKVIGRGGTMIEPVRQHIINNPPTAAIIFTDLGLYDGPMKPLPKPVPIIWVCMNNPGGQVNFGKIIYINE